MATDSLKDLLIYSTSGTGGTPSSASAVGRDAVLGVRCAWKGEWRSLSLETSVVRRAFGQRDAVPPVVYPNQSPLPLACSPHGLML